MNDCVKVLNIFSNVNKNDTTYMAERKKVSLFKIVICKQGKKGADERVAFARP